MVSLDKPTLDDVDVRLARSLVKEGLLGTARQPVCIGRFEVEEPAGFGAMGRVYVCSDPTLRRRVALKLLRPGEDDNGAAVLRERLIGEAQALARLSHPNVVAVYEVGTEGDDVFLAMEYVAGPDLRTWMRPKRPWRSVVSVFVDAGRGLAAAHRAGIIHRDFKPQNVVVGDDGRVRVLDFGLAVQLDVEITRAGEPASPEQSSTASRRRGPPGTPAYLAPELRIGGIADERSDQYSFCVSLYEALHGARPGRGTRASDAPAWVLAVLDRGLAENPADRFDSMDALVAALLADPSARRRRIAVTASVLAVAAVGLGLWELDRRRDAAECQRAAGSAFALWGTERKLAVADAIAATGGPTAGAAVRTTYPWLDDYAAQWAAARREACPSDRPLREEAARCLDDGLTELDVVLELLAKADRDMVLAAPRLASELPKPAACLDLDALRRAASSGDPPANLREVNRLMAQAEALTVAGKLDEAREAAERAVELADWPPLLVQTRTVRGVTLSLGEADYDAARDDLRWAFREAQALGRDELAVDAALGLVLVDQGLARYDEALQWGDLGLALLERLGESGSERHALMVHNVASVHEAMGAFEEAKAGHMQALELRIEALGPDDPRVASSLVGLGNVALKSGRLDDALERYEEAHETADRVFGQGHPVMMTIEANMASTHLQQGRLDEAEVGYRRVIEQRTRLHGPDHPAVNVARHNLATVYFKRDDLDAAEAELRSVLASERRTTGEEHPAFADALGNVAAVAFQRGKTEEGLGLLRRAIAIRERVVGQDDPELFGLLVNLAHASYDKPDEARAALNRAQRIADASLAPDDPRRVQLYLTRGELAQQLGQVPEALKQYDQAEKLLDALGNAEYATRVRERAASLR